MATLAQGVEQIVGHEGNAKKQNTFVEPTGHAGPKVRGRKIDLHGVKIVAGHGLFILKGAQTRKQVPSQAHAKAVAYFYWADGGAGVDGAGVEVPCSGRGAMGNKVFLSSVGLAAAAGLFCSVVRRVIGTTVSVLGATSLGETATPTGLERAFSTSFCFSSGLNAW